MADLDVTIHTDAIKRATAELAKMVGSVDKADRAVDKLEASSVKTNQVLDRLNTTFTKVDVSLRGANGQFIKTADNFNKNASEIHKLRLRYDEAYSSSVRYAQEVNQLNKALSQGAITPAVYGQNLLKLDQASEKVGTSSQAATHHISNLSFQLNDIGIMMASGQSPFMLMLQQGPQVAQILSQMKTQGQGIGSALSGAFRMILNPMTAVTLGFIAGTAALYQWAVSSDNAAEKAKTFDDQLSELQSRMSALSSGSVKFDVDTGELKSSLNGIVERYGSMNAAVRQHIALLQKAQVAALALSEVDPMKSFRETFKSGWLTTQVDEVRIALGTTNDSARSLIAQFKAVEDAKGLTNKRIEAEALAERIATMTGGIENMNSKQLEFYFSVVKSVDELRAAEVQIKRNAPYMVNMATAGAQVEQALRQLPHLLEQGATQAYSAERATAYWEVAMSRVKGEAAAISSILAGIAGIQISATSAKIQADLIERTGDIKAASRAGAEYEANAARLEKQNKLIGEGVEFYQAAALAQDEFTASMRRYDEQVRLSTATEAVKQKERDDKKAENEAKAAAKRGASAAKAVAKKEAAEVKAAEKGFQTIRELMEKESLYQFAEYEKRQTQLDVALSKRLLSQQNYEKMREQLRVLYFGADYEKNALQYQMDLEQLNQHHANKLLSDQEYYRARKELHWKNLLSEENRSDRAQDLANTATYFGQLHSLTGSSYDGILKLQQTFQAASALMNAYTAASQVLADPTVSYWMKFAAAGKVLAAGLGMVKAIKGGGSGGGKAAAAAPSTPAADSGGGPNRNVNVTLIGEGPFSRDSIVRTLEEINKAVGDGSKINVRAGNG